ncbi:hypothetical protein [Dokdonella soli]|uniref:Pectate lyase n=1 Tax=Dokdonella soli TaxID=529810 RepID=A0ABN1IDD9_9GAMM
MLLSMLFWMLPPGIAAFPTDHFSPGEHAVAMHASTQEAGEPPFLGKRTLTSTQREEPCRRDQELANAARWAAKVLAERQQGPGYWLTSYTDDARFEQPHQEMNTFTNAIMVDIAGPVAEAAGIAGLLAHARDFLASQIEAGGLVRYHGRPDAPTIGKLGCAITPDADDTALIWRIAPGARRELLPTALATLNRFRTADGLYKTWLAPQDRYECIDPGKDPNPADIGIQMHVLMLLAQVAPPAAHALCRALSQESTNESVWVYYRAAPLIPLLRLTDLQKAGCSLQLPRSRQQTTVPGQEVWVEAAQLLRRMESTEATSAVHSKAADLLRKLAANEFSLVAHAPPLLYHNDFSAHVRRFYWSEDVGYALWLRLYFENERARLKLPCRGSDAKVGCAYK